MEFVFRHVIVVVCVSHAQFILKYFTINNYSPGPQENTLCSRDGDVAAVPTHNVLLSENCAAGVAQVQMERHSARYPCTASNPCGCRESSTLTPDYPTAPRAPHLIPLLETICSANRGYDHFPSPVSRPRLGFGGLGFWVWGSTWQV